MNPNELQKKKLVDSDYLKKILKFGKKNLQLQWMMFLKKKKLFQIF